MTDIKINHDGYLVLQNGDFVLVRNGDAVRQHLEMRLRTWLEETPYNRVAGVPYLQVIFKPGTGLQSIKFILEQIALGTPGVTGVEITLELDPETRVLTASGTAEGIDGPFEFSVTTQEF
jgi:hypothetical protein